ncbi:hypothetical protein FKW77_000663 [Venturia effusa]|uniref:EF-hand domain-containing protein n=1 Tax=Venturia effusa TaxID=50376 RepID=A0A517LBU3_9PEZI|nr:hypothetical protein FKW77_000663 [Venturia effusa]
MEGVNFPNIHPVTSDNPFCPLSEEEIDQFFEELDTDKDGIISFDELEAKLEAVHEEIAPDPRSHHLHHPERRWTEKLHLTPPHNKRSNDIEQAPKEKNPEHDDIHAFLTKLMPECGSSIDREVFRRTVKKWNVPSQDQNCAEDQDKDATDYENKLSLVRKARAHWAMKGPKIMFIGFVIALQLAFGLWQLLTYVNNQNARAAYGWGVIVAKGSAGVLYPTLFFMVLSMSRWFATACRRFYYLSRFVDWDRHQSFHVWMACVALFFATLHAIGHLAGTFVFGSSASRQDAVAVVLGAGAVPRSYTSYLRSLPGWSGLVALGLFWLISLLSAPQVRKWSYEIFQLAHLLMFPFLGLLCAHGAAKLLQYPMLGFWLAAPTLLVLLERAHRLYRGIIRIPAKMELPDEDTVVLTCKNPGGKPWRYSAGQYIFLQVPSVSFFQWHPFTISACRDDILQVHIKCEGEESWTGRLRNLSTTEDVHVGIDGPFGAPAQRFYEYERAVIIGSGVGVTPFSAILTDIEAKIQSPTDPWGKRRHSRVTLSTLPQSRKSSLAPSDKLDSSGSDSDLPTKSKRDIPSAKRVDFHWLVREKNYLLWFSDLLNRAHDHAKEMPAEELSLNIRTHITMKRKKLSTHIFRYLLDAYRTPTHPVSALTGLKTRSEFGRPDFEKILGQFHEEVKSDVERAGGSKKPFATITFFFKGFPLPITAMKIQFSLPKPSNLAAKQQSDRTEQIRAKLEDEEEDEVELEDIPSANAGSIRYKRHFAQPSYSADDVDFEEPFVSPANTPPPFTPHAGVAQESADRRRNTRSFEPEPHALRHLIKREDDIEMGGMDEMPVAVKTEEVDEDIFSFPAQAGERSRGSSEEPEWLIKETQAGITFYLPRDRRRRRRRRYIRPEAEEKLVGEEMEVKVGDTVPIPDQHTLGIEVFQRAREAAAFFDLRYRVRTTAPPNPFMPASLRSLQSPITSLLPPKGSNDN